MNPDYRYVRDLLQDGYIGELRSVRLHISVEYFQRERKAALHFTIPPENFSSLLSIYGGHYFDAVLPTPRMCATVPTWHLPWQMPCACMN
ncbi:hypothetical protein [Pseudomonas sp. GL-B-19]|uniref:hypothetical protein n=1 Tax=Pseudomonas sp. GL-B-19 TaxID=2832393 RepID=UPI001CBD5BAA|nr:hypothetical protein [Pseudomonas sp. GL-B-19]